MQGAIPIFSRSLLHLYSLRAQLAALTLESCGQCQFLSRGRILLRQAFRRARAHSRCNAEALRTPSCRHPVLSHACRPAGAGSRSIMASVLPQQHEPSLAFDACHKAADAQHTVLTDYLSGRLAPHRRIYLIVLNWDLPACIVTLWQQGAHAQLPMPGCAVQPFNHFIRPIGGQSQLSLQRTVASHNKLHIILVSKLLARSWVNCIRLSNNVASCSILSCMCGWRCQPVVQRAPMPATQHGARCCSVSVLA